MKRVISSSVGKKTDVDDFQRKYTADEIIELLSQIKELDDYDVYCSKSNDGKVTFVVGNSAYHITEKQSVE